MINPLLSNNSKQSIICEKPKQPITEINNSLNFEGNNNYYRMIIPM